MKETAQAKLRASKKKGRGETGDEDGLQRRTKNADSPEKGAVPKKIPNGIAQKAPNGGQATPKQVTTAAKTLTLGQTTPKLPVPATKQTRGLSPQTAEKTKRKDPLVSGNSKQNPAKSPQPVLNVDADNIESTIAAKNLSELESKKTGLSAASKGSSKPSNGKLLPPRQTTKEGSEFKISNTGSPGSPQRPRESATGATTTEATTNKGNHNDGMTNPLNNAETKAGTGVPPAIRRSSTVGLSIPSAIEFDPLKSALPNDLGISLDADGRSSPVDTQSVSSIKSMGYTSADVGLGSNPVQLQFPQTFEGAATGVPLVGIAQPAGFMGFQQQPGVPFQQGAMMPMAQSPGLMPTISSVPSNLSLLQQPFLQVSDQTSLHSVPMIEQSQPMLLIHPRHVRGISELTTPEAMLHQHQQHHHQQMSNLQETPSVPPRHVRANSLQMPMNPFWNQNAQQWATSAMGSTAGGAGQQYQTTPPAPTSQPCLSAPDPFDELAMNSRSAKGK